MPTSTIYTPDLNWAGLPSSLFRIEPAMPIPSTFTVNQSNPISRIQVDDESVWEHIDDEDEDTFEALTNAQVRSDRAAQCYDSISDMYNDRDKFFKIEDDKLTIYNWLYLGDTTDALQFTIDNPANTALFMERLLVHHYGSRNGWSTVNLSNSYPISTSLNFNRELVVSQCNLDAAIKSINTDIVSTKHSVSENLQSLKHYLSEYNARSSYGALWSYFENKHYINTGKVAIKQLQSISENTSIYIKEHSGWLNVLLAAFSAKHRNPNKLNPEVYQYTYTKFPTNSVMSEKELMFSQYKFISNIYTNRRSNDANTYKLSLYNSEKHGKLTISINLNSLYPTLKEELKKMKQAFALYASPRREESTTTAIKTCWRMYNAIRNKLLLLGYKDEHVSKTLCKILKQKMTSCQLTNQYIPVKLAATIRQLDESTITVNQYYVDEIRHQSGGMTPYEYVGSNHYNEQELPKGGIFNAHRFGYRRDPMDLLSVLALPNEDTKVYGKGRPYRPTPFLGVELEVQRKPNCDPDITTHAYNLLGREFVIFKNDGSIEDGNKPFEIVSVPATLAYHHQAWAKFFDDTTYRTQLKSFESGKCGMHVHISRDSFTGLHLAKFMRFINSADNYRFMVRIAQRGNNSFTNYQRSNELRHHVSSISQGTSQQTRYVAVNLSNPKTIEVRIFRGNLGKVQFYKNLEFVHAAWLYTKNCGMNELSYKDFLHWLFKDNNKQYANLSKWLVAHNFNVSNVVIKRDVQGEQKLKLEEKRKVVKKIQSVVKRKYEPTKTSIGKGSGTVSKEDILLSA